MIGSRRYRIAEPPRTSGGPAHSPLSPEPFSHLRAGPFPHLRAGPFPHLRAGPFPHLRPGPALRARAPPGDQEIARADNARPRSRRIRVPDTALGQRRHPLAQANHAPPETDYGTQPNTERSYGMTTKTTSARAHCKGSVGPSSCGIAQAGGATPVSRGSEP
jgi:hypothetical protein